MLVTARSIIYTTRFNAPSQMTTLTQAIQNEDNIETLFGICQSFLKCASNENIDSGLVIRQLPLNISNPHKAAVVTLLKLELLIFHTSEALNHDEIQHCFKSLEQFTSSGQGPADITALIKVKYQDLLTDYNLCFSDSSKRPRLVDLMNKKLNILKLTSASEKLTEDLRLKILLFYLLSEADLRKRNIHHYLKEEGVYSIKHPSLIEKYVGLVTGKTLIPLYVYNELADYLKSHYPLFRCLFDRYEGPLLEFYFENNVQKLTQYFKSIRIARIPSLLTEQQQNVDFENLVFRMIVGRQLPEGTHIDQVQQMVIFGAKTEKYDAMNCRIKRIGEMVDSLAT